MTKSDLFDTAFNERAFCAFITKLLPDFQKERRPIITQGILNHARLLGVSEACQTAVIVVHVDIKSSRRKLQITREAFRILRQHRIRNALIAFYTDDETWRLSLLTSKPEIKNCKLINKTSDPKRYSYLLGLRAKTKTPRKFLLEQGTVANLDELKERFSVEAVNQQFYHAIALQFTKLVGGERGEGRAHRVYTPQLTMPENCQQEAPEFAARLIGRIIFCWFLKEKQSLTGLNLMPESLMSTNAVRRHPEYYHNVLERVFFGCLNTEFEQRTAELKRAPFNQVPYLNGGLFNPQENDFFGITSSITIADEWFIDLFKILEQYAFTVDENTSSDIDLSIDPEMLGRIFENLLAEINPETGASARKSTGSFYTPREIVAYMVDEALLTFLKRQTCLSAEKLQNIIQYENTDNLALADAERESIVDALSRLKILDPACGSGAFPIGILQKVFHILQQVDVDGKRWYKKQLLQQTDHELVEDIRAKFEDGNNDYIRKLGIIQRSIFGVDIQPIATEIAKLRCFLTLMIEEKVDDTKPNRGIHPLPNLDFKFVTANSLKFLPENPNDPFNMFETGNSVEAVKKIRTDYFLADKTGREFLKTEFSEAQNVLSNTQHELALARYRNLSKWQPFAQRKTDWFDSEWMFGVKNFDIVIGNPPYGATLTKQEQSYFMKHYRSANSETGTKGSLDTFALFIERGLSMLSNGGNLVYIVPMAITSNDTMVALQNELEQKCETIRIASFANRPRQIFDNACVRTSIIFCEKTNTPTRALYMTRQIRRKSDMTIQEVINNLEFVEAYRYKKFGRYPKVGSNSEIQILEKLFQNQKRVQDYASTKSTEKFYYRAAGGRYFNIVTLTTTGTSAEREYRAKFATLLAACLSTSLFWFYQQVYTDGFNLKGYEIDNFPVPNFENMNSETLAKIQHVYYQYLDEIEKNAALKNVAGESRYNVQQFKEYKIVKSKDLIDQLDDLVCPLYGLSREETEYIKKYEAAIRMGKETSS